MLGQLKFFVGVSRKINDQAELGIFMGDLTSTLTAHTETKDMCCHCGWYKFAWQCNRHYSQTVTRGPNAAEINVINLSMSAFAYLQAFGSKACPTGVKCTPATKVDLKSAEAKSLAADLNAKLTVIPGLL